MCYVPNAITILRIFLSFVLLLGNPSSNLWLYIYAMCVVTDILDGLLARKYDVDSELGAKMDSVADLIFCLFVLISIRQYLVTMPNTKNMLIIAFLFRIITILIGYMKFKRIVMLHTILNKTTGIALSLYVPLLLLMPHISSIVVTIVFLLSIISSLEQVIIVLKSKEVDLNVRTYFKSHLKR